MESLLAAAAAAAATTANARAGPVDQTRSRRNGQQLSQHVGSQPPSSEANVLDALFQTSSFSAAAHTAGQQRDNQVTPLMAQMLLGHYLSSLANNAGQHSQSDQAVPLAGLGGNGPTPRRPPAYESTPIQTTRSGRISRPPVQPPSQNLLADLQGKIGMGPILEALATTGLIPGGFAGAGRQPVPPAAPGGALAQFAATVDKMQRSQQSSGLSFANDHSGFERDHSAAGPSVSRGIRSQGHHGLDEGFTSKRVRIGHVDQYDDYGSDHTGPDGEGSDSGQPRRQRRDRGIPQEEVDRRRKERNRKAAQNSRKRKQLALRSMDSQMADLEKENQAYKARIEQLEQEVESLRQQLRQQAHSAATSALASPPSHEPPSLDPSILGHNDVPPFDPNMSFDPNFFNNMPSGFDFDNLLNFAADDDDDLDFVPNTSPQDEASDDDDDEEEEETPRPGVSRPDAATGEEVFEENLFLPIEDVQIPPDHVVSHAWDGRDGDATSAGAWGGAVSMDDLRQEMMRSLNVHTTEQFRVAMEKLLESAGDGGIAPEVKDQLSRLISSIKEQEEQDRA